MKKKCLWLFGLSGAGKTTLANALAKILTGCKVKVLDCDILRKGINQNLGFSDEDRFENVRRTAEIAQLFLDEDYWVIVALITPLESMRENNKKYWVNSILIFTLILLLSFVSKETPKVYMQKPQKICL